MKKNKIALIALLAGGLTASLSSCQEDPETWNSATNAFDGRFVMEVLNEEMKPVADEMGQLYIYNSAQNKADEIWLNDVNHRIPLQSKFTIKGEPKAFQSAATEFAQLTDNLSVLGVPPFNDKEKKEVPPPHCRRTNY